MKLRGQRSGKAHLQPGSLSFDQVLNAELQQIAAARRVRLGSGQEGAPAADGALVGLALSGGGGRSATFGLGVIQGLARFGLLRQLDYLSSTGGGGHIAGFLTSWIRYGGYHAVEERLTGNAGGAEAPEIRELRQATTSPLNRGVSTSLSSTLVWLRNVALNLIALAAVSGALLLVVHGVIAVTAMAPFPDTALPAVALAAGAAILLAIQSLRAESRPSHPARLWIFWSAILLVLAACAYFGCLITVNLYFYGSRQFLSIWSEIGSVIAAFCFLAWFPRNRSAKTLLVHTVSAAAAGAAGGLGASPIVSA